MYDTDPTHYPLHSGRRCTVESPYVFLPDAWNSNPPDNTLFRIYQRAFRAVASVGVHLRAAGGEDHREARPQFSGAEQDGVERAPCVLAHAFLPVRRTAPWRERRQADTDREAVCVGRSPTQTCFRKDGVATACFRARPCRVDATEHLLSAAGGW